VASPNHREQNQAAQWAMSALRRYGLDTPPESEIPERPDTQVVQEGRRAAARRYRKVASELAFEAGVKEVVYDRRSLSGKAYFAARRIHVPEPTTRRRLLIFAHECGHIALGHEYGGPPYREEFEAERWAIAALRRHDIAAPRKELDRAKRYVTHLIWQALQQGVKTKDIDREAMRFAGVKARHLKFMMVR
jgi:hypothetical protein